LILDELSFIGGETMLRPRTLVLIVALALLARAEPASAAVAVLRVTVTGAGGAVELTPPGVGRRCAGATCDYLMPAGKLVTLNAATTLAGVSLARWVDQPCGRRATCSVQMDGFQRVTARFTPVQIFADEPSGSGTVTPNPVGTACGPACWAYPYASEVTVTATPADGWMFRRWYGACASVAGPSCHFNRVLANVGTSAGFDCAAVCTIPQRVRQAVRVNVNVAGAGAVTVFGAGVTRTCSASCVFAYWRGTMLSARARSLGGSWGGWSGACAGPGWRCQTAAFKDLAGADPVINATFG
jgi:hypothetical protein